MKRSYLTTCTVNLLNTSKPKIFSSSVPRIFSIGSGIMQQGLGLSIGFMVRIVCCCFNCCHLFENLVKVNYFYRKKESTEGYSAKI